MSRIDNIFYDTTIDNRRYILTKDKRNWIWAEGSKDSPLETIITSNNTCYYSSNDKGYVLFLEEQLKKAEDKIENMHKVMKKKKNPGYCVECFENIPMKEIICGKCQDERDGRNDHLRK